MSRARDTAVPEWARNFAFFNRQASLERAHAKLRGYAQSVHPDDKRVAEIFRDLDLEIDDFVLLVDRLSDPGSSKPLHRPRGSAIRQARLAWLSELQGLQAAPLQPADVRRANAAARANGGVGYPRYTNDATMNRELSKLLPGLAGD